MVGALYRFTRNVTHCAALIFVYVSYAGIVLVLPSRTDELFGAGWHMGGKYVYICAVT